MTDIEDGTRMGPLKKDPKGHLKGLNRSKILTSHNQRTDYGHAQKMLRRSKCKEYQKDGGGP